jgi:hypothetical protein
MTTNIISIIVLRGAIDHRGTGATVGYTILIWPENGVCVRKLPLYLTEIDPRWIIILTISSHG